MRLHRRYRSSAPPVQSTRRAPRQPELPTAPAKGGPAPWNAAGMVVGAAAGAGALSLLSRSGALRVQAATMQWLAASGVGAAAGVATGLLLHSVTGRRDIGSVTGIDYPASTPARTDTGASGASPAPRRGRTELIATTVPGPNAVWKDTATAAQNLRGYSAGIVALMRVEDGVQARRLTWDRGTIDGLESLTITDPAVIALVEVEGGAAQLLEPGPRSTAAELEPLMPVR